MLVKDLDIVGKTVVCKKCVAKREKEVKMEEMEVGGEGGWAGGKKEKEYDKGIAEEEEKMEEKESEG